MQYKVAFNIPRSSSVPGYNYPTLHSLDAGYSRHQSANGVWGIKMHFDVREHEKK